MTESGGTKHDHGKPQIGLASTIFILGLSRVLTFGATKYAAHNWRKGIAYSRLYDALQRHLLAFWSGEDVDSETGESHLDHAACCLMFLREMKETRPDMDDRYILKQKKVCINPQIVEGKYGLHPCGKCVTCEMMGLLK